MATDYTSTITVRAIEPQEFPFLEEMLYQAIFVPDKRVVLPRDITKQAALRAYIEGFGRTGDVCLVAVHQRQLVGAIWVRLMQGYGFVNASIPELSMAIQEAFRGKGLGQDLLGAMLNQLEARKIKHVSLSVDRRNYAYDWYRKHGFKDYSASGDSVVMVKELRLRDDA